MGLSTGTDSGSHIKKIICMQIQHNYIRPHQGLDGDTPAERARIRIEGNNKWKTIIQNASLGKIHNRNDNQILRVMLDKMNGRNMIIAMLLFAILVWVFFDDVVDYVVGHCESDSSIPLVTQSCRSLNWVIQYTQYSQS